MEQIPSGPMAGRTVLVTGGTGGIGRLRATASINVEDLSSFFSLIRLCSDSARTDILRKAFGSSSLPSRSGKQSASASRSASNKCLHGQAGAAIPQQMSGATWPSPRPHYPSSGRCGAGCQLMGSPPNYTPVIYVVKSRYELARPVKTPSAAVESPRA